MDKVDAALLRRNEPLRWSDKRRPNGIRVVDLFSGCGGMTLGVALAAVEHKFNVEFVLAVDTDKVALAVHGANFRNGVVEEVGAEKYFAGPLASPLLQSELELRRRLGRVDILVGGPPCQGNSNLNNHTRRTDPRNALYSRMARAADVLQPKVVIIENVPTVIRDRRGVVAATKSDLERQGYLVGEATIPMTATGVPQKRRRYVVMATRVRGVDPQRCLDELVENSLFSEQRTVRWAFHDLRRISRKSKTLSDTLSNPTPENLARMEWLIENDLYELPNDQRPKCHQNEHHSYHAVYGRMRWNEPAPTITTGFRCNGQGRYVHPEFARTITPHEAARVQTFPDFFDFSAAGNTTAMARLIGNAVPPFFMRALVRKILPALT